MPSPLERWLETRPPAIRRLAAEFPLSTLIELDGVTHYVMGYGDGGILILTPVDPMRDYDRAMDERVHVCASHFRP
jgi:hypothetical protein